MAVDTNPPSLRNGQVKQIHNLHHMLKSSGRHILPALIKASDSVGKEMLWNIAESNVWNNSIRTKGVFPWLLQIKNRSDVVIFKFRIQSKLFDEPLGRALHG